MEILETDFPLPRKNTYSRTAFRWMSKPGKMKELQRHTKVDFFDLDKE